MGKQQISNIVFISNYFNHHQKPLSDELYKMFGEGYLFLETEVMSRERRNMGWKLTEVPPYVITKEQLQKKVETYKQRINNADIVIIGSASEYWIKQRKKQRKLILRYSERLLKRGFEPLKYVYRLVKWRIKNYPQNNIYMLCASAYTAADCALFGLFKNRCYAWGYFPEMIQYDNLNALIERKKKNSIVWVARFIDWKHPETVIEVAERLKKEGYKFSIDMIGNGILLDKIIYEVYSRNLSDCITIHGAKRADDVRYYMERAEIHLFTSDRNEGWGAVLNESMNSACVPVANHAAGATPFLVRHNESGMIYMDGDVDDIYCKVKLLFDNNELKRVLAYNAYNTVIKEWNAKNAAIKLIMLAQELLEGRKTPILFENGICSKASIIKDNWFK